MNLNIKIKKRNGDRLLINKNRTKNGKKILLSIKETTVCFKRTGRGQSNKEGKVVCTITFPQYFYMKFKQTISHNRNHEATRKALLGLMTIL